MFRLPLTVILLNANIKERHQHFKFSLGSNVVRFYLNKDTFILSHIGGKKNLCEEKLTVAKKCDYILLLFRTKMSQ